MGKALYENLPGARIFDQANEIFKRKTSELGSSNGTEESLSGRHHTAAIFTISCAAFPHFPPGFHPCSRNRLRGGPQPGEYSALFGGPSLIFNRFKISRNIAEDYSRDLPESRRLNRRRS